MSAAQNPLAGWYAVAWHYPGRAPIWGLSRDEHGHGAEFLRDARGVKRTFTTERDALEAIEHAKAQPGTTEGGGA